MDFDFFGEEDELEVYTVVTVSPPNAYLNYDNLVGGFIFGSSPNTVVYSRSVYTFLGWLGDVGGLRDALLAIGHVIVGLFSNSSFSKFLIGKLFYLAHKRDTDPKKSDRYQQQAEESAAPLSGAKIVE